MTLRARAALRGFSLLESRLAPAVLLAASGHSATYTDVDGDHVTIAVSSGDLTTALFGTFNVNGHDQLALIDLSNGGFDDANLSVSVMKASTGDGLVNVGFINSSGHDLGRVTVKGDLGRIDAGDTTTATPGLKSLSVRSLGRLDIDTQGGGDLVSNVNGRLGSLVIGGDMKNAFIDVTGGIDGKIGAITIGGSLIGGSAAFSGEIRSSGDMGAVKIGHDVQGGTGTNSGFIRSFGKLASVSIGGSLLGGWDAFCGTIKSNGDMGAVKIGHNVEGGSSLASGLINSLGKLAGVTIGGSLIGGSAQFTGGILSSFDMGAVKIGHDLTGGSITGLASLDSSGMIESYGRISSVAIGGSIISGINSSYGALTNSATVRAEEYIGSLTVAGSLIGNGRTAGTNASPVIISARGRDVHSATSDLAIGKITIGGRVEFANILAGYGVDLTAITGDAQIGAVKVGGDWIASNLVAGAMNAASGNTKFGDVNDALIDLGAPVISKIGSITISGQVFGTPNSVSTADHFAFVAEQIGSLKIGGNSIALSVNPHSDNLRVGETSDMTVHEV